MKRSSSYAPATSALGQVHDYDTSARGLAPLSSMYFFGENQPADRADYYPDVHDANGLSVRPDQDEWLWQPMINPKRLLVTSFTTTDPLGFGLQ